MSGVITVPVSAGMYQTMVANIQQLQTNSDGTVCVTPMVQVPKNCRVIQLARSNAGNPAITSVASDNNRSSLQHQTVDPADSGDGGGPIAIRLQSSNYNNTLQPIKMEFETEQAILS